MLSTMHRFARSSELGRFMRKLHVHEFQVRDGTMDVVLEKWCPRMEELGLTCSLSCSMRASFLAFFERFVLRRVPTSCHVSE